MMDAWRSYDSWLEAPYQDKINKRYDDDDCLDRDDEHYKDVRREEYNGSEQ